MENTTLDYLQKGYYTRGRILNNTISLELGIEEYIVRYISNEETKRDYIMQLFLSTEKITFGNKTDIFMKILKLKTPDAKEFNKDYDGFATDLEKVVSMRNRFAHDIMPEIKPEGGPESYEICLRRGSTNKYTFYTNELINAHIKIIDKCQVRLFYAILKTVIGKPLISHQS